MDSKFAAENCHRDDGVSDYVIHYPPSSVDSSQAVITIREESELGLPAYYTVDPISYKDLPERSKDFIQHAQNIEHDPVYKLAAIKAAYALAALQQEEEFAIATEDMNQLLLLQSLTDVLAMDINLTF
jgi:hypothetical protein